MLTEVVINLVVLGTGLALGYKVLPIFFKHNPNLMPSVIADHLKIAGLDSKTLIEAHAKNLIDTVKAEAAKLGVTLP